MSPQGVAGTATVTKIRGRHAVVPVYNLTVEGTSRYLVGACGVVVHNTNGCGAGGGGAAREFVDLTGHRATHILNRHRAGAGKLGKSEFPARWSDEEILHHVSDIATDPNAIRGAGKWDSPYSIGTRDGVTIRVDFFPTSHPLYGGKISTAYPIASRYTP
jgi:hypothetical protein